MWWTVITTGMTVLGFGFGWFLRARLVRGEIEQGIAFGVTRLRDAERFEREQSMKRNGRETYRRPEHEGQATRIGEIDYEPS